MKFHDSLCRNMSGKKIFNFYPPFQVVKSFLEYSFQVAEIINNIQKCQILTPMSYLNSLNNTMIQKICFEGECLISLQKG